MVISLQDMTQASFRKTHIEYMVINHYQLHMGWYGLQVHSHEPHSSVPIPVGGVCVRECALACCVFPLTGQPKGHVVGPGQRSEVRGAS